MPPAPAYRPARPRASRRKSRPARPGCFSPRPGWSCRNRRARSRRFSRGGPAGASPGGGTPQGRRRLSAAGRRAAAPPRGPRGRPGPNGRRGRRGARGPSPRPARRSGIPPMRPRRGFHRRGSRTTAACRKRPSQTAACPAGPRAWGRRRSETARNPRGTGP